MYASEVNYYMRALSAFPLLTDEQIAEYVSTLRNEMLPQPDRIKARNKIVEGNLRLVINVAKKYRNRGVSFDDLIQEGNKGLIKAAEMFDPLQGKFSTYALYWIKQKIRQSIQKGGRTIKLSENMFNILTKWNKAKQELHEKLGREPDLTEIAAALGISEKKAKKIAFAPKATSSISGGDEDNDFSIMDNAPCNGPEDILSGIIHSENVGRMPFILSELDDRTRQILELRYGLVDGQKHTLDEVGIHFGLTKERIRQLESAGIKKLQRLA